MPNIKLDDNELKLITACVDQAIGSAKRQQALKKQPEIQAVYEKHEQSLQALKHKINTTK